VLEDHLQILAALWIVISDSVLLTIPTTPPRSLKTGAPLEPAPKSAVMAIIVTSPARLPNGTENSGTRFLAERKKMIIRMTQHPHCRADRSLDVQRQRREPGTVES